MKNGIAIAAVALYGASAFAVATISTSTCRPDSGVGPIYTISITTGGAPTAQVNYLTVTRQEGDASVSATVDRKRTTADDGTKLYYGGASVQYGSAEVSLTTFSYQDPASHAVVGNGYLSWYKRASTGTSLLDVQLPSYVPNAALVNTNPPLVGYSCVDSIR